MAWKSPQADAGFPFKGTKVKFSIQGLFRFGQLTSTSEKRQAAEEFGHMTFFVPVSCQGFPVGNLSRFPWEEGTVVLPYEMFQVTGVKETPREKTVHAKSVGVCSNHNCGKEGNSTMSCPDHPGAVFVRCLPGRSKERKQQPPGCF
ncbi:unnamed protein product [Lepidochelys olivacea]